MGDLRNTACRTKCRSQTKCQMSYRSKGVRKRGRALHEEVRKILRKSTSENRIIKSITQGYTAELCYLLGGRSIQQHASI